ncbi:hypothetical protein DL764_008012 [Monosporascus ibericus]|uniref:Protein kinase domain-containing protein n=1 Tax=Monosporascus ibericus TaxID=155417 RepID=A0A4Q4SYK6_9PEZI|nr:hypothetical protein DL764_008012 [Monosporascus ibericus]
MTGEHTTRLALSRSYGILDRSISFGRRTTARLPRGDAISDEYKSEQYDFIALMTAVAELYSQDGVLEMQIRDGRNVGKHIGSGAVSGVSSVFAAVNRPSTVVSHQVKVRKNVVVLKKSTFKLFLPNGGHNDEDVIRGFISEIRILSHRPLRDHPNIIKILGVHWDFESAKPLVLLERASTDLADFQSRQDDSMHRSLPFTTKKSVALDVACGLSALHKCGIVHGDVKPQNVLIFNKPTLHAKIADFSHSVFDTGGVRKLVSIPYHSLNQLSPLVMDHVVSALQNITASPRDTWRTAAWVDLAICHSSGITRHCGLDVGGDDWKTSAVSALLHAVELGDFWARAIALRISKALGEPIPASYDLEGWLFDATSNGSSIAFESLVEVNRDKAMEALRAYRATFCGNPCRLYLTAEPKPGFMENPNLIVNERRDTVLHWVASVGHLSMLQAFRPALINETLVNDQNEQGDPPLLSAARVGHFDMLRMLINLGADAGISSTLFENPLHFLTRMNSDNVIQAARLLVDAGADPTTEATGYSGNTYLDFRGRGRSCPMLRAVFSNNVNALDVLISLTKRSRGVAAAHQVVPLSTQRSLLAWAPCHMARNALFFAIREGRDDAVRFLEIPISKKKKPQRMLSEARHDARARSPPPFFSDDDFFELLPRIPRFGQNVENNDDDSYEDPDEDSALESGSDVYEGACPHVTIHHYKPRRRKPSTTRLYHCRSSQRIPTHYRQIEGIVDAVLMSILLGKRNVLHALLTGAAKATIQVGDRFPCFVNLDLENQTTHYNDDEVKAMADAHTENNLVSYFPVQVWRNCVTLDKPVLGEYSAFDGIIRYPLTFERIVTLDDVPKLLEDYPGFNSRNWRSGLWEVISAANGAQQKKPRFLPPKHTDNALNSPVMAAALRRDLVALQHLLDFDDILDVDVFQEKWWRFEWQRRGRWTRLLFPPVRTTALDVASWTASVESSRCDESGLLLKSHDKRIADFLASRGAARGADYVFEVLLARVLIQHALIPLVAIPVMIYLVYASGAWVTVAIDHAREVMEALDSTFVDTETENVDNQADDAQQTWSTSRFLMFYINVSMPVIIPVLMSFHYGIEPESFKPGKRYVRLSIMFWVSIVAGAVANLIALSVLGTGNHAGKVFGANLLVCVNLEVCLACVTVLLMLFCLVVLYAEKGHLIQLSDGTQSGSPRKYVWAASVRQRPKERPDTHIHQGELESMV